MKEDRIILVVFCALPLLLGGGLLIAFRGFRLHAGRRGRALRLVAGNLLVFLFLGSMVLLVGELYCRHVFDTTDSFALTKVSQAWFDRHYRFNNVNFRDSVDYRAEPELGMRRVTFLGDSFLNGHGVPDVEDRFANRIRRAHPDWEVHAIAGNGWGTDEQLSALEDLARGQYPFDQIVLVYGLNDIAELIPGYNDVMRRIYGERPGWVFRHSYFLNLVYYRTIRFTDPEVAGFFHFVEDAYTGEVWEKQSLKLRRMVDLARSRRGRFSVITFPFLHAVGPDYEYGKIHETLSAFWKRMRVPHLDLIDVYGAHRSEDLVVNPHDAHPNEKAHELAADAIAAFLAERMRE